MLTSFWVTGRDVVSSIIQERDLWLRQPTAGLTLKTHSCTLSWNHWELWIRSCTCKNRNYIRCDLWLFHLTAMWTSIKYNAWISHFICAPWDIKPSVWQDKHLLKSVNRELQRAFEWEGSKLITNHWKSGTAPNQLGVLTAKCVTHFIVSVGFHSCIHTAFEP